MCGCRAVPKDSGGAPTEIKSQSMACTPGDNLIPSAIRSSWKHGKLKSGSCVSAFKEDWPTCLCNIVDGTQGWTWQCRGLVRVRGCALPVVEWRERLGGYELVDLVVVNNLDRALTATVLGQKYSSHNPIMSLSPPRSLFRFSTHCQDPLPPPPCFVPLHRCDGGYTHKTSGKPSHSSCTVISSHDISAAFRMYFPDDEGSQSIKFESSPGSRR